MKNGRVIFFSMLEYATNSQEQELIHPAYHRAGLVQGGHTGALQRDRTSQGHPKVTGDRKGRASAPTCATAPNTTLSLGRTKVRALHRGEMLHLLYLQEHRSLARGKFKQKDEKL